MAYRHGFGQTWWGQEWLNALARIDYGNRLPRGRSYANNGSVDELEIRDGVIRAKVWGSRPRPYSVVISVPAIASKQMEVLLARLAGDPVVISKMLNRDLDHRVLEYANELGISVFPTQWKDLSMKCSCPDWAVPCKHLAAVIYLFSREIDGNPFLVFSIRGVDVTAALKAFDISIENQAQAGLVKIESFLGHHLIDNAAHVLDGGTETERDLTDPDKYRLLDYSRIKDFSTSLVDLLSERPPFYQNGDFRSIYEKSLKRISSGARKIVDSLGVGGVQPKDKVTVITVLDRPHLAILGDYTLQLSGFATIKSLPAFMTALGALDDAQVLDYQPEVAAFYHLRMAALHLLAKGAVFPQVFEIAMPVVGLRWLGASMDPAVRSLVLDLSVMLPKGLVSVNDGTTERSLNGDVQAATLLSVILDYFVVSFTNDAVTNRAPRDGVTELFFGNLRASFAQPGEGEIASGIEVWLSRLSLGEREHSLALWLEEHGENFALSIGVTSQRSSTELPVAISKVMTDETWKSRRYSVLQDVSLLADYLPLLDNYLSTGGKDPIVFNSEFLARFLFDTLPVMRILGIRTIIPKGLESLVSPRISMSISGVSGPSVVSLSTEGIFDFDWKLAVGDVLLTSKEFEEALGNARGVVKFRGQYVYLDPTTIERLKTQLENNRSPSKNELIQVALAGEFAGTPVSLDKKARALVVELTRVGSVAIPKGLNAELRPYQKSGFAWLSRNLDLGFGSVIADDMGLGKTIQVIAAIAKLKNDGDLTHAKALVIVPTGLLTNWVTEFSRFAPGISCGVFHGSARNIATDLPDVVITTYGVARTDLAKLKKHSWRVLVIDEAQNIKNPTAAQTKAVKAIPAKSFVAMTGTPVENRLSEYWCIMDFANRGYLGGLTSFNKEFSVPIQSHHDQAVAERFKRITAPFLLRRVKSDKSIIADLPDKVESDGYCELTKIQAALYESVVREGIEVLDGTSDTFRRQGVVLQMIMALKQICNHPAQFLKSDDFDPSHSGKAALLYDLLEPIYASHEKVLVFTQFAEMGRILSKWISEWFDREPLYLHGGIGRAKRDEYVQRFQNDATERAFILSLKAGGTGLNLTAANNVIHFDLWWNPAVESQATDRAYRIGQKRNVQVHRFITKATFEEQINDMISSKKELADFTVGAGETWIGNLNNKELKEIFTLRT